MQRNYGKKGEIIIKLVKSKETQWKLKQKNAGDKFR